MIEPETSEKKTEPQMPERVVVITGASQGIGAGVVTEYRRRGWGVVGNALSMKPSDSKDLVVVEGDISKADTATRIVDAALDRFGRIDTLVNDAGIFMSKPFTEYTADDYSAVVGVNLTGFFNLTQLVIKQMLKQHSGHVVNITTTLVDYADSSSPSLLASLTKGGLAAATRSLAIEYAARGIRVNAVSPGVIRTTMRDPEAYDAVAKLQPMGRVGEIGDIVDGILFLESASFITGETLHIDGGRIAGH
jgi:NAD(P)-dependent dehydrogenase (short-subunit alcohol dehydrogenase family)